MPKFEYYGCVAAMIFIMVGYTPAIMNFLHVYRSQNTPIAESQRKLFLTYYAICIALMPFVIAFLVYALWTGESGITISPK